MINECVENYVNSSGHQRILATMRYHWLSSIMTKMKKTDNKSVG